LGVLGPLVGVIGSMQAAEALKLLCNYGAPLIGRLLLVNARQMTFDEIKLKKNLTCSVCGT
jgi:adenylyltransferase/sulfurtransferase